MLPRKSMLLLSCVVALLTCEAVAQKATLKISVTPSQAYVFVDGSAIGPVNGQTVDLPPGRHDVFVHNYGYKPMFREIELAPDAEQQLDFRLEQAGGPVAGPFGAIQIETSDTGAAVLLNGSKPEYLVGHVDEFNNHLGWQLGWKQQLLVPVGSHNVTVVDGKKTLWSGKVNVGANQRVIIYIGEPSGTKTVVKDWPEGSEITTAPRFTAGTASATVAVAPVTANFSVEPKQINCNAPAKLAWKTTETLHTAIASDSGNFNELPVAGEETVSPRKTTTYQFKTSGPGGVVEIADTLNVNPTVEATLSGTPEVRYLRVGDKVLVHEAATLTWGTSNADNIVLDAIGKVNATGAEKVTPAVERNTFGPVDESKSYEMVATNVCGGSETKQATVRLSGLIEPMIGSVFFPTAYPVRVHPNKGLLLSQQKRLERVAEAFKAYLQSVPDAKLRLTGMADERGNNRSNYALSDRRVSIVKDFLVAKGIPSESIILQPKGEEAPLDQAAIEQLEVRNPQQEVITPSTNARSKWLAYNRRVDMTMEPAGLESARFYPHQANDSILLMDSERVTESKIFEAPKAGVVVAAN